MAKSNIGQNDVKPTADGIAAAASAIKSRGPAPVHLWNPPFCGDLDMRIARDGTWFYNGSPIGREAMVRLFSNILKREGDAYFLVTPAEKVGITVDDAPFLAVDFDAAGGDVTFVTRNGDHATAGPDHPIRVAFDGEEPQPYVMIRNGMEALIDRKSFYRLVDLAEIRGGWLGIPSGGAFFPLIRAEALG